MSNISMHWPKDIMYVYMHVDIYIYIWNNQGKQKKISTLLVSRFKASNAFPPHFLCSHIFCKIGPVYLRRLLIRGQKNAWILKSNYRLGTTHSNEQPLKLIISNSCPPPQKKHTHNITFNISHPFQPPKPQPSLPVTFAPHFSAPETKIQPRLLRWQHWLRQGSPALKLSCEPAHLPPRNWRHVLQHFAGCHVVIFSFKDDFPRFSEFYKSAHFTNQFLL